MRDKAAQDLRLTIQASFGIKTSFTVANLPSCPRPTRLTTMSFEMS